MLVGVHDGNNLCNYRNSFPELSKHGLPLEYGMLLFGMYQYNLPMVTTVTYEYDL